MNYANHIFLNDLSHLFLSENKHAISFLLIFSEVALMIYGYIIDFHFGNIVLYVFCSSFIFCILASPFLIAKTRDENGDYMGKTNSSSEAKQSISDVRKIIDKCMLAPKLLHIKQGIESDEAINEF